MLLLTEGREPGNQTWVVTAWMLQPRASRASRAKIKAFPVTIQGTKLVGEGDGSHTITATLLHSKSNPHPLSYQHRAGKSLAFRKDYMTN